MASETYGSNPSSAGPQDEKARARARIGQTVNGKYRLDALLGVGGMASVYAASHRNGSRAALKILHTEFARDDGIRDRFLREGYVANRVEHIGRVAIQDDDITEQGEPFLVMELLEGETLQQLWKRKNRKVPPAEALSIADQILETLALFHAQGIVHRDLKPANIFICSDGIVKLLDFGVARMREAGGDKTRAGTALGTPSFMAPEQAMGLTDGIDGRADIFSVGATLYAVLSGKRLHQGRSDNEAFILAATAPAPSLAREAPDLPVEVIALVDRALAWDPRNRFESANAMREDTRKVLASLGALVEPKAVETRTSGERPAVVVPEAEPSIADPNDPAVIKLVDCFRRVERLLPTVRQFGWAHPEAHNKLRAAFTGFVDALKDHGEAVRWTVEPYSFSHRGRSVWEPSAPLDTVPYYLFAAGVRSMQLHAGLAEDELRSLCEVLLADPYKDLSPEDDLGSLLWEKQLPHLSYDVIHLFAEGDAADREAFYEEADDLERVARRAADERRNLAEAAAMNVQTDASIIAAQRADTALALDPATRKVLASQLAQTSEQWSERFVDVLVEALIDARRRGDAAMVLIPLEESARDLAASGQLSKIFEMFAALCRSIEAGMPGREANDIEHEVARGMFSGDTLRLVLRQAIHLGVADPEGSAGVMQGIDGVLTRLDGSVLEPVMEALVAASHPALHKALFRYVERAVRGRELEIAERTLAMDLESARPLLSLLGSLRSQASVDALRRVSNAPDPGLRCEAIAQLCEPDKPEQIKDELMKLLRSPQPTLRAAALRTLAYHQVKAAGPLLVKQVQDESFNGLPIEEKRELFAALFALHASRAEALAIEIIQKHGLLADAELEETRAMCAEALGEHASSPEALDAVLGATKRRWWNTEQLRDAAFQAAESIARRQGKHITPAGEVIG